MSRCRWRLRIHRNSAYAVTRFPNHPHGAAVLLTMSVPKGLPYRGLNSALIQRLPRGRKHSVLQSPSSDWNLEWHDRKWRPILSGTWSQGTPLPLTFSAKRSTLPLHPRRSTASGWAVGSSRAAPCVQSSSSRAARKASSAARRRDGELEDVTGLVTSVSGSNFTMNVGQSGAQLCLPRKSKGLKTRTARN